MPEQSFHIIPLSFWLSTLLVVLTGGVLLAFVYKKISGPENDSQKYLVRTWLKLFINTASKPLLLVIASYLIYGLIIGFFSINGIEKFYKENEFIFAVLKFLLRLIEFSAFFWFVFRVLNVFEIKIQSWASSTQHKTIASILPMVSHSLQAAIILLMVNMIVPELSLNGFQAEFIEKLARVLFIAVLGWIFVQTINGFETVILNQYAVNQTNDASVRKIRTQTLILKRIILTIGMVVVIAAILMVFDSVQKLGTGLLTTAGIVSAVGAFASQQSLGRIFSGLQLAFTQPIKIGDTIVVENELGTVEEISLSYVVVKIWDLRRLILPTDYFSGKGFQNLTLSSADLIGSIFLYVDHTISLDALREKFQQVINESTLWNHKVSAFHVSDMKEHSTEVRLLVSANDAGKLWDLRCEVREKLIKHIAAQMPDYLPKVRNLNQTK